MYRERVPLERLRALAQRINALLADVPMEDPDFPRPLFELASYEARYRQMDTLGGAHVFVLRFEDDELVALRDSRLGLAAKARTLQLLREREPAMRTVLTNNAATNAPMLRINAQLGFRVFRESAVYEIARDALVRALEQTPP